MSVYEKGHQKNYYSYIHWSVLAVTVCAVIFIGVSLYQANLFELENLGKIEIAKAQAVSYEVSGLVCNQASAAGINRAKVQAMIDQASASSGENEVEVVISGGCSYYIGDLRMKDNVTIVVSSGTKLIASQSIGNYFTGQCIEKSGSCECTDRIPALFFADNVKNIGIRGGGQIMGVDAMYGSAGQECVNKEASIYCPKNLNVVFVFWSDVSNGTIENIRIDNFKGIKFSIVESDNINILNNEINSNILETNHCSDAIDVFGSQNVVIKGNNIASGDDNIALKVRCGGIYGPSNLMTQLNSCENIEPVNNVLIEDNTVYAPSGGHGLEIGFEVAGEISNVTWRNNIIKTGTQRTIDINPVWDLNQNSLVRDIYYDGNKWDNGALINKSEIIIQGEADRSCNIFWRSNSSQNYELISDECVGGSNICTCTAWQTNACGSGSCQPYEQEKVCTAVNVNCSPTEIASSCELTASCCANAGGEVCASGQSCSQVMSSNSNLTCCAKGRCIEKISDFTSDGQVDVHDIGVMMSWWGEKWDLAQYQATSFYKPAQSSHIPNLVNDNELNLSACGSDGCEINEYCMEYEDPITSLPMPKCARQVIDVSDLAILLGQWTGNRSIFDQGEVPGDDPNDPGDPGNFDNWDVFDIPLPGEVVNNPPSTGDKIYVSAVRGDDSNNGDENSPLKTIEAAISKVNNMSPVVSILVAEGNYAVNSSVNILENFSLYGGYSVSSWSERDAGKYQTNLSNRSSNVVVFDTTSNSFNVLDGFFIQAGLGSETTAIRVNSGSSPVISNNYIFGGNAEQISQGIYIGVEAKPQIVGNNIDGGKSKNSSYGINSPRAGMALIAYNNIVGGDTQNSTTHGIYSANDSEHIISSNRISGGHCVSDQCYSCAIREGGGEWTYTGGCAHSTIINNILIGGTGYRSYGILSSNGSDSSIANNLINAGGGDRTYVATGIYIKNDDRPKIINNIIYTSNGPNQAGQYCIYENSPGVYTCDGPPYDSNPGSLRNNNLFNCPSAYVATFDEATHNIGKVRNFTTILTTDLDGNGTLNDWNNISEDISAYLDNDYRFTGDKASFEFDTAGLNGAHSSSILGFINDKDANIRTPSDSSSTVGWSMGPYEY